MLVAKIEITVPLGESDQTARILAVAALSEQWKAAVPELLGCSAEVEMEVKNEIRRPREKTEGYEA